jgi:hypothetical protein
MPPASLISRIAKSVPYSCDDSIADVMPVFENNTPTLIVLGCATVVCACIRLVRLVSINGEPCGRALHCLLPKKFLTCQCRRNGFVRSYQTSNNLTHMRPQIRHTANHHAAIGAEDRPDVSVRISVEGEAEWQNAAPRQS